MTAPKLLFTIEQPHGLGELYFTWQKGESRFLLATTGTDATVAIHDRFGQPVERIKLPGLCAGMEWDNDGDNLAMITPISNSVILWECHTNKKESIETGLREPPSCLAWAHGEPLLAIGTTKGNLVLYNHNTTKRVPILGKHAKKITCGVWNKEGVLVLASEDKTLTISNNEGDTLRMISLRDMPNDLQVSEMKTDERSRGENTISLIVGKRTLYLYNLLNPENPIELAFQQRYGSIVSYKWYGDGYILIGFSAGYVIAISTHIKEVGEELFQMKNHKDSLTDIAVCRDLAATCGDGELKVASVWSGGAAPQSVVAAGGDCERAGWSADGRLLAAAGRGRLAVFVAALPRQHAALGRRVLALTSLAEATLHRCGEDDDQGDVTYALPAEPALLGLGAAHAVLAAGARAWFVPLAGGAPLQRHYPAPVTALAAAGDHVALMFADRAMLHAIEQPESSKAEHDGKMFPEPHMQGAKIVDIKLTTDFFIFVTDRGEVEVWSVERWSGVWRAAGAAGRVWADAGGARLALVDARGRLLVLDAGTQLRAAAPPAAAVRAALWDGCLAERDVLVAWGGGCFRTYSYSSRGHTGAALRLVGCTPARPDLEPAVLFAGDLYCLDAGGSIVKVALESHHTAGLADADVDKRLANQKTHIGKLLLLRRFSEAWLFCDAVDDVDTWRKLGEAALADLNIEFAIRVYTRLSDVAMVWALEDALHIEELPILCGVVCAYLGEQEAAARWLETSGRGAQWALALHAAAARWEVAVRIARQHAPHCAPALQYRRGHHLYLAAQYHEALAGYEAALVPGRAAHDAHNARCEAGIARCAVRCGDAARGLACAARLREDKALLRDCAQALLDAGQPAHAAQLYHLAGDLAHAADLYITLKSWLKVEALLPNVDSPGVHLQYARAKEAEGRYREALGSYLRAQDFESAIRLNLDKLDDVDEAVALVQETKSIQGAKMVADFFQNGDEPSLAIKFLVMSLCYDEAFQLARKNGKLHLYGEILIETAQVRPEDFRSLALHFEGEKNHLVAGKFFFHAGEYKKALSHLLKVGGTEDEENEAITVAIDAAAASDDDRLTRRLIEFLLGESDGTPRDPKHLFRLYMAKKQYLEAAKTAVIIASAEAGAGRYRAARDVVRTSATALRAVGGRVPRDLRRHAAALHSYILVRTHVKRERHDLAAMLLLRTAEDLSFFPVPQHRVSILTSTVIECARAGFKHEAYQWARVLMQPEYRSQIDAKYVKKIESVVRHAPRAPPRGAPSARGAPGPRGAPSPRGAPCPRCEAPLPAADLHCAACLADIPFCIATGLHIVKDDLTACPECDFPAIYSEFIELLKEDGTCPMCNEAVDPRRLRMVDDVTLYLDTVTPE